MKFVYLFSMIILSTVPFTYGQDWNIHQIPTEHTLNSVFFVDRYIGWMAGDEGTILHTSDGGQTWIEQNSRTSEQLNSIHFFDEITGWIAGNENLVLHTNSRGEEWSESRPNPVSGQNLKTVHFIDWKRGWTGGGPGGQVYFTKDRGATWQRQVSLSQDITIASIFFSELSNGVAGYDNHIHHTVDGGKSWMDPYQLTSFESFSLSGIHFLSDSLGWAIGNYNEDGLILKTNDGGQNWTVNTNFPDTELRAIHFADKKVGGVVGANGLILHTENAGETWIRTDFAAAHSLNDIYFPDAGSGWAVGENGSIYRYHNPDVPYRNIIQKKYPQVEFEDESEVIDLLNRSLEYGESALEFENPEFRGPYYSRMRGAIHEAMRFYNTSDMPERISNQISSLVNHYWAEEYNNGAELFNRILEDEDSSNLQEIAKFHFYNAILIQPDSLHSYVPAARIEILLEDSDGAINILDQAFDRMDPPTVPVYEMLIDLHLSQDSVNKALAFAETATEHHPEEIQFYEVLVDLHLADGETDRALTYLDSLIDLSPETIRYYQLRGDIRLEFAFENLREALRLYEEVWKYREELYTNPPLSKQQELRNKIEQLLSEVESLDHRGTQQAQQVVSDFEKLTELQPNNHEHYGNLGMIFQERAHIQYEMRTLTYDQDEARRYDPRILHYLDQAKANYERALEINPGIRVYKESLLNIYRHLGMESEAQEILEKIN